MLFYHQKSLPLRQKNLFFTVSIPMPCSPQIDIDGSVKIHRQFLSNHKNPNQTYERTNKYIGKSGK